MQVSQQYSTVSTEKGCKEIEEFKYQDITSIYAQMSSVICTNFLYVHRSDQKYSVNIVNACCLHWVFTIFSNVFLLESAFSDAEITIKVSGSCVDDLNTEKII